MKIYLAHNFKARIALRDVIKGLNDLGHEVTSTWITDDSHIFNHNQRESGLIDLHDIDRADCLVLYVDPFADQPGKGKFVELGYALARNKKIFICGKADDCVFYHLPNIKRISSIYEVY